MFCIKCGNKNQEGNLFCEYCGAKLINKTEDDSVVSKIDMIEALKVSSDSQTNNIKKKQKASNGKKWIGLIIALFSFLVLAGGVAAFFLLRNKPLKMDGISYYQDFEEDDIVFPEEGEAYVKDQLLVKVSSSGESGDAGMMMHSEEITDAIKPFKGKVVGYNSITLIYQIAFSDKRSGKYQDLMTIADELKNEAFVEDVTYNYVYYSNSLMGEDADLDSSLMGIANSKFDDSLVGSIRVSLIGTNADGSGILGLLPGANLSGVDATKRTYISLYGWESDITCELDAGSEILEITDELTPTDEKEDSLKALNEMAASFMHSLVDTDYRYMMFVPQVDDKNHFITSIEDAELMKNIIRIGATDIDSEKIDLYSEGTAGQSLDYVTSIAIMTWLNNQDLSSENLKDIMVNSYIDPLDDLDKGVVNAEIATRVAERLRDYMATATDVDATGEITREDIIELIMIIKDELGYIDPVKVNDSRYRDYFNNNYADFADFLGLSSQGATSKYAYYDFDLDGEDELLIGYNNAIYGVVTEVDGKYYESGMYGWQVQQGGKPGVYIGNGCFTASSYNGNNYGGESQVYTIWKYDSALHKCGILARLSSSWALDTPGDELPQDCWELYKANDEDSLVEESDIWNSDAYSYEYLDYGNYYNRDTGQEENDLVTEYNNIVESHTGVADFNTLDWKDIRDFEK